MTFYEIFAALPAGADVAWLHRQCVEEGTCWLWPGVHTTQGYPVFYIGRPARYVTLRRVACVLAAKAFAPRQPIAATCGNKACVNPAHLRPSNASVIGKASAARGMWRSPVRGIRISRARLAKTHIDTDTVRAIRAAPRGTVRTTAEALGVKYSTAMAIRSGRIRREYASPWAGMGARP